MGRGFPAALSMSAVFFAIAVMLRMFAVDPAGSERRSVELRKEALISPGRPMLRLMSMEHRLAMSDLVWLQVVQIVGSEDAKAPGVADRLVRWSYIATDLDPLYYVVYYAAGVNLMVYGKRATAADGLFELGAKELPLRWEFPFLLGYTAYFYHGRPREAAKRWLEGSKRPDPPLFIPSLVARSTFQAGDRQAARQTLMAMIPTLRGPHREDAIIRLKLFDSEELLEEYDAACKAFRSENGRMPTPAELMAERRVSRPPRDFLDTEKSDLYFDEKCIARTQNISRREFEAAEMIGSHGKDQPPSDLDVSVHDGNEE